MSKTERKEIIEAIVGGDRHHGSDLVPEVELCEDFEIEMVSTIGAGGKVPSSSWFIAKTEKNSSD